MANNIDFLLGIIIGALIWQLITVFAYLSSKEDEDIAAIWGMGFWRLLIYGCSIPIYHFNQWLKTKRYVAMMKDIYGCPCYCPSKDIPECLQNIGYSWNEEIRNKYKIQDGWDKSVCFFDEVNLRYTPIKIAKVENAYKISREIIHKAIKETTENQKSGVI